MTEREERTKEEGARGMSKQGRERGGDDGRKGEKGDDRGVEETAMGVRGEVGCLDEVMAKLEEE